MRFDSEKAKRDINLQLFDATVKALVQAKGNASAAPMVASSGPLREHFAGYDANTIIRTATDEVVATKFVKKEALVEFDPAWIGPSSSFIRLTLAESVIGRLTAARRMPFNTGARANILAAGASWIREGGAIPITRSDYAAIALQPLKAGGMIAYSLEFEDAGPDAAPALTRDLSAAVRAAADVTFCSDDAEQAGSSPAGVANDAVQVNSTGSTSANIAADLRSMVAAMASSGCSLRSAIWVMSHEAYVLFRLLRIASEDGTIGSLPAIASEGAKGRVLLLAQDQLALAVGDTVVLAASTEGMVQTTDSTGEQINLFSQNAAAVSALLFLNWQLLSAYVDSAGNHACIVMEPSYA